MNLNLNSYQNDIRAKLILSFLCLIALKGNTQNALPESVKLEYEKLNETPDYNKTIKPILSDKCFACHGNDRNTRKAGLRLDLPEAAYGTLPQTPGRFAIVPGHPSKSELVLRILSDVPEYMMPEPQSHLVLTDREKALLYKWVKYGAPYQPHWAFITPKSQRVPELKTKNWSKNPIDHFIAKKLEENNLAPSSPSSKELILRRLSLDLTGLPPTIAELDDYLSDNSSDAYEKQVDRLLRSPHYGEKMAIHWLDLARFADSHGYTVDRLRDMSPYRDWVINAFNKNLSYDQFITQQLAGDLMPTPSTDMLIATAFNRNHPQNMEGGIIEEEFQTEYVIDRTNTFGEVFIGLSLGCARCHDHKFDPVSQKNYYELFSFFNTVKEAGQIAWNNALPTPTLLLPSDEKKSIIQFINQSIRKSEEKFKSEGEQSKPGFESWLKNQSYQVLSSLPYPNAGLQAYYPLDTGLNNLLQSHFSAQIRRETDTTAEKPVLEKHDDGKALVLDGDGYMDMLNQGQFRKSDPFSIGIWIKIPTEFEEGVLFHKSIAERLYNFRGYHVYFKAGKLQVNMAHTSPADALTRWTKERIPSNQWLQLTLTYDGSSQAAGLKLFMNGQELELETSMDQLSKDIHFEMQPEPALQIGGWWRGLGFKGGRVDDILVYNRELTHFEIKILAKKESWKFLENKFYAQLTESDRMILWDYYKSAVDSNCISAKKELADWRRALSDSTASIPEIMVMQEMKHPPQNYILKRGIYSDPGEAVYPSTPEFLSPFDASYPKNRLGLAQWLTDPSHPLTARVAANRIWQNFFGKGLVKTAEDFGNQGESPSHPELLDWLAMHFIQSGWDIKELNKLIVLSATYRQDSRSNLTLKEIDPENRLIARGPAVRLSAEILRDQVLTASGLLNEKIGGKSIKPYQPEGLWEINSANYKADTTPDIYRRSLYILVKRSVPNPTLALFDAPDRSACTSRRQQTQTPSQALVLLNDPTYLEAAKVMGESMCKFTTPQHAIKEVYRKLTALEPTPEELNLLNELYQHTYERFKTNPAKTKGWLDAGLYKINKLSDPIQVAAFAVIASTIINSDATIMKR